MNHIKQIRLLLAAQLISSIGDALTLVASFAVLYAETGDPVKSALPLLVKGVAQLAFAILAMRIADRIPAKRLSVAADILRFALIGAIVLIPHPSLFTVLALQGACTAIALFFNASREKFLNAHIDALPDVNQQRHYVALDNQYLSLTEIVGFGIGFLLVAGLDYRISFFIDSLTFLASALVLLAAKDISTVTAEAPGFGQVVSGVTMIVSRPDLLRSTAARLLFWVGAGIYNMVLLTIVAEAGFISNPASPLALARSIEALGFMLSLSWIKKYMATRTERSPRKPEMPQLFFLCTAGLAIAGLTTLSLIPSRMALILIVSFFGHGVGTGLNSFGMRRIRQLATTDIQTFRARITAASQTMANLGELAGTVLVVLLVGRSARSTSYIVCLGGIFFLLSSFAAWMRPATEEVSMARFRA